jgi:hypothetical protein
MPRHVISGPEVFKVSRIVTLIIRNCYKNTPIRLEELLKNLDAFQWAWKVL